MKLRENRYLIASKGKSEAVERDPQEPEMILFELLMQLKMKCRSFLGDFRLSMLLYKR
jgi:hypothetical protein